MASTSELGETQPTSALPEAAHTNERPTLASEMTRTDSSSLSSLNGSDEEVNSQPKKKSIRPKMGSRKSSTIIVPYDTAEIEVQEEEYDENDARTMSPRRSSEEIERMGEQARESLMEQAKQLQTCLLDLVDQVETVKTEHDKLEGGNRFLQSYIGELMQTSKITSTKAPKGKGKGRATK